MIPLSIPNLAGNEWKYVKDCLDTGWISSAGQYVTKFEDTLAAYTGAEHAIACMNGTVGIQIALQAAGVQTGDYVIAPNLTFVATLNAISYTGAQPIIVDVDEDTWQMDLALVEKFLEQNTHQADGQTVHKKDGRRISALLPVHMLGNMPDMHRLMSIAEQYRLLVIEDAAEALGSFYDQEHSGTIGTAGVISFNGNKIVSTGGGGVILTNDAQLAQYAKHLTTQAKISENEYDHDEVGYNYRMVNVLAAIGVAQMEQLDGILQNAEERNRHYKSELSQSCDALFQECTELVTPNNWMTTVRVKGMRRLLNYLQNASIQARPLWKPMNLLPMYSDLEYISERDVSNSIYCTALSLPSFTSIDEAQLTEVTECIRSWATSSQNA